MVCCSNYQIPSIFKKMKCLVHTKGKEEMCFYNGVHLFTQKPKKHRERPLKIISPFNWDNISFPPTREDLRQFEKNNPNCYILVFGYDEERERSHFTIFIWIDLENFTSIVPRF